MSGRIDDLTSLVDNGQPFRNRIKEGLPQITREFVLVSRNSPVDFNRCSE